MYDLSWIKQFVLMHSNFTYVPFVRLFLDNIEEWVENVKQKSETDFTARMMLQRKPRKGCCRIIFIIRLDIFLT